MAPRPHLPPGILGPLRVPAVVLLSWIAVSGCATTPALPGVPPAEEIPRLEARSSGGDPRALTALGAAYVGADRPDEALVVLRRAAGLDPSRADTRFFLGLALEDLERPGAAVEAFEGFLETLPEGGARTHVVARIRKLRREEARASIQAALERESDLAEGRPPAPATVAVLPFAYQGRDERLQPLGRALAHMLSTDLSATDRLTVLERVEIEALLDELRLTEAGLVDPATALRGGRLLGAAEIVQGRLDDLAGDLTVEAAVVSYDAGPEEGRTVAASDELERFYALETELALRIYETLGIALTAAERERVTRRATESLEALLLFGQGLEAEAAGSYEAAAGFYRRAAALDVGFEMASSAAATASALSDVASMSPGQAFDIVLPPVPPIELNVDAVLDQAGVRDAVLEALGSEGIGREDTNAVIRILFPRPGGGP
jgi:tetratricopeptide (TPR) repeat protein